MPSPSRSQAQDVMPPGSLENELSLKFTDSGDGPEVTSALKPANKPDAGT